MKSVHSFSFPYSVQGCGGSGDYPCCLRANCGVHLVSSLGVPHLFLYYAFKKTNLKGTVYYFQYLLFILFILLQSHIWSIFIQRLYFISLCSLVLITFIWQCMRWKSKQSTLHHSCDFSLQSTTVVFCSLHCKHGAPSVDSRSHETEVATRWHTFHVLHKCLLKSIVWKVFSATVFNVLCCWFREMCIPQQHLGLDSVINHAEQQLFGFSAWSLTVICEHSFCTLCIAMTECKEFMEKLEMLFFCQLKYLVYSVCLLCNWV